MSNFKKFVMAGAMLTTLVGLAGCGPQAEEVKDQPIHKVVIQVSSADPKVQTIAVNNAINIRKALGRDNVDVEVVAYGPGLGLLVNSPKNKNALRVTSLAMEGVKFDACGNTMKKIEKKTGHKPKLAEGVKVVPGGVIKIMQLQEAGYSYVRP